MMAYRRRFQVRTSKRVEIYEMVGKSAIQVFKGTLI